MDSLPVVVLGSGVAGVYAALKLAPLPVLLVSPAIAQDNGSSHYAQGGIAAAMGEGDSPQHHLRDTVAAGAGLVDEVMAKRIVEAAPECMRDLQTLGVVFDPDAKGGLALAKEAAHSCARVLHLDGDRSGARLMQYLGAAAKRAAHITLRSGLQAVSLDAENGRVQGVWLLDELGNLHYQSARCVVLATGGMGGLYEVTTNPPYVLGQGIGMAAKAGAMLRDCEFVQFHPTALAVGGDPMTLVTEALRGAGALLVNAQGERIMQGEHDDLELAPRDVVARTIERQIRSGGEVFLDARQKPGAGFEAHFPQVYAACLRAGIDPAQTLIPITPAAHYSIGGVASDAHGQSTLAGLYANGEVACTGMHGANRLASNSLLEGLVMGGFIAQHIQSLSASEGAHEAAPNAPEYLPSATPEDWASLRCMASQSAGIVREAKSLEKAQVCVLTLMQAHAADLPFVNSAVALLATISAALERRESRGCHYRSDYAQSDASAPRHSELVWNGHGYDVAWHVTPAKAGMTP